MSKPEHRWQTRVHVAVPDGPIASALHERLALRFGDGHVGSAELELTRQVVDGASVRDPDLVHAVKCWLAARGTFDIHLVTAEGQAIAQGPFSIDDLGDAPTEPARAVVTLAPSNAEVVEALGAFDRVCACEDSTDVAGAAALPRLGPDLGPDLDAVAGHAPDLVVSSLSVPGMERVVTGLRARGLRQVVLAPRSLADVLHDLVRVGRYLGCEAQAQAQVASLHTEIEALRTRRRAPPVRVYLEWWPRPMFSPGRDTYANEIIALAGGVNVFGDRPGASVRVEPEDVQAADPEVCFVSWCGVPEHKLDPQHLGGRPGLAELSCVQHGRVFALDERYSGRPGPRVLEAARRMAAVLSSAAPRV